MNGKIVEKTCQNVSLDINNNVFSKQCCAACEYMCVEGICHNDKSDLYMDSPETDGKSIFDYKCGLFETTEKYDKDGES